MSVLINPIALVSKKKGCKVALFEGPFAMCRGRGVLVWAFGLDVANFSAGNRGELVKFDSRSQKTNFYSKSFSLP